MILSSYLACRPNRSTNGRLVDDTYHRPEELKKIKNQLNLLSFAILIPKLLILSVFKDFQWISIENRALSLSLFEISICFETPWLNFYFYFITIIIKIISLSLSSLFYFDLVSSLFCLSWRHLLSLFALMQPEENAFCLCSFVFVFREIEITVTVNSPSHFDMISQ
jgi:hypothetical protein